MAALIGTFGSLNISKSLLKESKLTNGLPLWQGKILINKTACMEN